MQRRFVVIHWRSEVLRDYTPNIIHRGYSPATPNAGVEVQFVDGEPRGYLYSGVSGEHELPAESAIFAGVASQWIEREHHFRCLRFEIPAEDDSSGLWVVDRFEGLLADVVMVRREAPSLASLLDPPSWIFEWKRADVLTEDHFISLAQALRGLRRGEPQRQEERCPTPRVPCIALCGPGADLVLEELYEYLPSLYLLPALAGAFLERIRLMPFPDQPVPPEKKARAASCIQRALEQASQRDAALKGRKMLVVRREGPRILDAAGQDEANDRYEQVLWIPGADSSEGACDGWEEHPTFQRIPTDCRPPTDYVIDRVIAPLLASHP